METYHRRAAHAHAELADWHARHARHARHAIARAAFGAAFGKSVEEMTEIYEFVQVPYAQLRRSRHHLEAAEMRRRYEVYAAVMGHIRDVPEYQGAFEAEVQDETVAHMARSGGTSVEEILGLIADEEGRSFDRLLRRLRKRHTRVGGPIASEDDVESARKRTAYRRIVRQVPRKSFAEIGMLPFKKLFGLPIVTSTEEYEDAKARAVRR
jgi:hypothetical protein